MCKRGVFYPRKSKRGVDRINRSKLTLSQIVSDVCKAFDVDELVIRSKNRKKELVLYRQIYIYVAVQKTDYCFEQIGNEVCLINHTTIIHHIEKVSDFLKYQDPVFMPKWNEYLERSELFSEGDFKYHIMEIIKDTSYEE
jgi:chromosomal replication initiation ATPase DnaA